jgi:hypothetical protein
MIKKILQFGLIALVIGGAIGVYMWNKPHEAIGKPDFTTTATELAAEFGKEEEVATAKYVGKDGKMIVIQVSGKIADVKNDTSGITIGRELCLRPFYETNKNGF